MIHLLNTDRLSETLQVKPTNLGLLLEQVTGELQPFLQARRQVLQVALAPDLGQANLDADKIGDALMNLVLNAIKFTPDEGTIRVAAGPDGPDRVKVEVSDTGIGIAAEEVPFLFQPFFTGYDSRHHSSGDYQFGKRGIGLGLNLVKRFVEMHGGTVSVESELGHGSTFSMVLPRTFDPHAGHLGPAGVGVQPVPEGVPGPLAASGSGIPGDAAR